MPIFGFMQRLRADERGGTAVEYALIASLVVLAIVSSIGAVADETAAMWNRIEQKSRDAIERN